VNFETGISSSRKSILLESTLEEEDKFIGKHSYILHVTMIYCNPRCARSIGKFLWNNVILPHLGHLLLEISRVGGELVLHF
jgi:hypothetical protein